MKVDEFVNLLYLGSYDSISASTVDKMLHKRNFHVMNILKNNYSSENENVLHTFCHIVSWEICLIRTK